MTLLYADITLEIDSPEHVSGKVLHTLRQRLQTALDEAADMVLADLGIVNTDTHTIHVGEIEQGDIMQDEIGLGDE